MCVASGMNRFLLGSDRVETGEHRVDVARVCTEIENGIEVGPRCDLVVAADELAKVELFVPRAHRVALHEPVRVVPGETGLDECEQHTLTEEEEVARLEIAAHALLANDEAIDQPREAIEHVVDREKYIGEDDSFRRRVRDVALVPERDV